MSDIAQRDALPSGRPASAAQLGAELQARRQSLGWTLPDLAASLRIRQPYLEAIEAGRIGDLPGITYALGFVRAYASALGLSGEQVASRFRAETAEANMRPPLTFPAPVPQRGVPAGALMLLGLVLLAGAYASWYYVSEHQSTPPETVPPIPDRLLPPTAEKPAPSPQVASILPSAAAPAQPPPASGPPAAAPATAAPLAVPQPPAAQPQAVAPAQKLPAIVTPTSPPPAPATAPAAQPAVQPAAPQAGQAAAPAAAAAASPAPAPQPALPAGTRIVLKATADAWVTVKQKGGPPLLNKLMHAGETWPVPQSPAGLTLTTGNAGATGLDVDGTPVVSLGGSGMVRRDLPLDPDLLKSGHLPPLARHALRPTPVAPPQD